ncbi:MAG: putative rane protein [Bradyrhizobium sp.]|jgi:putative membrane protein
MSTNTALIIKTGIACAISVLAGFVAGPAAAQQRLDAPTFVRTASASDAFEIQSSRLALERSGSPRVRAFAQHMINDHSMTTAQLSQNAPSLVMFGGPGMLDERHAAMLSQLSAQNGPAFDRLYDQMQLAAHREAIALYSAYATTGDNPALVSLTRNTLPVLRQHFAMARRL